MMNEDIFMTRLQEIWNDLLLTNKYVNNSDAIRLMNTDLYPNMNNYMGDNPSPDSNLVNQALAQEPLNLIAYVVKNDLPFTDIAQGDYTVVNPFLAKAYGVNVAFKNSKDANEWHQAKVTLGTGYALPHAGIISTPVFLNRWPTTPTNRDRGRARRTLPVAARHGHPQDRRAAGRCDEGHRRGQPHPQQRLCTVCHSRHRPGGRRIPRLRRFRLRALRPEVDERDAVASGHGRVGVRRHKMPPSYYTHAQQWLGKQIAADPRFIVNAVHTTYTGLTGQAPLPYPQDNTAPTFSDDLAAWTAQDDFFRQAGENFKNNKFNLKSIAKDVLKSPYYRALGAPLGTSQALMAGMGTGRLLTPEMLSRKINAIMGFPWTARYDATHNYMLQDFYITYGGIDSNSVITRLTDPNGLLYAVQSRMANEVACHATAFDFTKPKTQRNLFPMVEVDEVPESAGHAVSGSVNDIKANIVYLFDLMLGQKVQKNDVEVERAYQLYLDTYHEISESGDGGLEYDCQGNKDPKTGADLPAAVQITSDANFTIRPWQAVITYMLSDYSFLYE